MDLHLWLTFFAASWAISLSPGAGAVAAMSSGLTHGFRRGYWTTAGLILGIWTQVLLVGAGGATPSRCSRQASGAWPRPDHHSISRKKGSATAHRTSEVRFISSVR